MITKVTTTAGIGAINWLDAAKGALVATITAALTSIYSAITTGGISSIDWKAVGGVALVTFVGYLIKNVFTPAQTIITNPPIAGSNITVQIPAKGKSVSQ